MRWLRAGPDEVVDGGVEVFGILSQAHNDFLQRSQDRQKPRSQKGPNK